MLENSSRESRVQTPGLWKIPTKVSLPVTAFTEEPFTLLHTWEDLFLTQHSHCFLVLFNRELWLRPHPRLPRGGRDGDGVAAIRPIIYLFWIEMCQITIQIHYYKFKSPFMINHELLNHFINYLNQYSRYRILWLPPYDKYQILWLLAHHDLVFW